MKTSFMIFLTRFSCFNQLLRRVGSTNLFDGLSSSLFSAKINCVLLSVSDKNELYLVKSDLTAAQDENQRLRGHIATQRYVDHFYRDRNHKNTIQDANSAVPAISSTIIAIGWPSGVATKKRPNQKIYWISTTSSTTWSKWAQGHLGC